MIAGSNPNLDRSEIKYGTEYRVEWFSPPYISKDRPEILDVVQKVAFDKVFILTVRQPSIDSGISSIQGEFSFLV
jgi:hypothetical protein